ncbi:uncharacterized protein LOC131039944 isoform X2 [Cryptomeria japonica]|uniref:uncharacterized protein LOC131039944 isoform X2 n=1 Tax=Cryptomeria japonica TaxID=3369 RepID=UPI0027DA6AE0|nr:uncharacterized protein LOC131039944 isoform X2 [Cryptomeria japonica]
MWKCRSLTRLLPWKNACQLKNIQPNVIPWTLNRPFSVEAADPETLGFTSPNQARRPGSIYAKLTGTGRYTLKMDIAHYFDGCGLTPEDIKVTYNRTYTPTGMILQFPSRAAFATALRMSVAKGRQYWLQEVDHFLWSNTPPFEGKVLLLTGIPRIAFIDDVERFLSGCKNWMMQFELLL